MDTFELKREQSKLARKIVLQNHANRIKTIGAATCVVVNDKLLASVVVCEYPSLKLKEKQTFLLNDPLPYKPGFSAYREMPAIIEAYNMLEEEPDVLLVQGNGILHPRKFGIASHVGLVLNIPTIGITSFLPMGNVEKGNILLNNKICGFEIKTKEFAKPVYVSPGNKISLGSVLNLIPKTIQPPHKMPEPLHLAHKIAKKKAKE